MRAGACTLLPAQRAPRGEVPGEGLLGQPGPQQPRSVGSACLPTGSPVGVDHGLWQFSHPAGIQLRGLGGVCVRARIPLLSLSLFGDFPHSAFDLPPCLPSRSLGSPGLEAEVSAFPIPNTQKHQWEGRGFRLQTFPSSPSTPLAVPSGSGDGLSPSRRGHRCHLVPGTSRAGDGWKWWAASPVVPRALGVLKGRGLVLSSSLYPCPPAFSLVPSILNVIYPKPSPGRWHGEARCLLAGIPAVRARAGKRACGSVRPWASRSCCLCWRRRRPG